MNSHASSSRNLIQTNTDLRQFLYFKLEREQQELANRPVARRLTAVVTLNMATLSVEKEKLNVAKPFAFHNGDGEAAVFDVIGAIKKWRITSQESSSAWVENSGSEDAFRRF